MKLHAPSSIGTEEPRDVVPSSGTEGVEPITAATPPRRRRLAVFAGLNALAAWGGALGLVTGAIDFGGVLDDRLPFDSLVLAGIALAAVVAIPLTVLAWSAWTGSPRTGDISLVVGVSLLGWIAVQLAVLRAFSLFQPAYLAIGAGFVAASHRVRLRPATRGVLLVLVGSVATAAGVGLAPHLIDHPASIPAVASGVALFGGLATVVAGGRAILRSRRRLGRLTGAVVTLLVVAVTAWTIAPAVAATNVPRPRIGATPASRGLAFEPVTLTTADGIQLAAWYVPGTNGAGVVVRHGAGSTRSDVLDQAAALASSGYAVLLVDARGHGDSGGTAMDFGWYGDADVAAGTAFLAARPEIDAARIGVVGFSMGGEEAIGSAASDPLVRAVVAEGATGRTAADKAWYSDAYGWRGWVQETLERVQDGVTDFLTVAGPPVSLRSAVATAADTRFLLITAGNVADEGRAAEYIASAAPDRVVRWDVEGADHTDGIRTRPQEWRQRVVAFLDEHLRGR